MDMRIGPVGAQHASSLQSRVSSLQIFLIRIGPGLTLLLATALRFYRLAGQSFWSDEGNSVALAQAGLGEIAARTALDIHPPLYYWLLHIWMRVFGGSEIAIRSLSAVAGVLLVAVVYVLGARLFTTRVGLLAAFITAVSPFQVYYAQEARMYTLLALLGALTVWTTAELLGASFRVVPSFRKARAKSPGPHPSNWGRTLPAGWALLYVLSATLGLYTHYAFPVVLAATNLAFLIHLWQVRHERRVARRLAGWLTLQLIPLAFYLPWLPIAWRQLTTWPAPPPTGAENAWRTVWRTLNFGPAGVGVSALWLLGFGLLALVGVVRLLRQSPLPKVILLLLYLGLPIGLTLVLFKPAYLKFLLVASPGLCLLLALGLVGTRTGSRRGVALLGWLGAALVVAAAWGPLAAYYTDPALARDDYRGMAHYLEAIAGPQDAIILDAAGQQEVFGYYYHGEAPVYPLPRQRPLDPEATVAELETILARAQRVFALYWATDESDPAGLIEGWLDGHAFKATDTWVGNVRLVSYAAPLPPSDLTPADVRLGDHVTLTGYRLVYPSCNGDFAPSGDYAPTSSTQIIPGEIVQVQLRWATDAPLDTRYVVFIQALDAANHLVGQRDAEPVISSLDWKPGTPVLDRHGLFIEPGTPPGEHRIIVGLYDAVTGQRLAVTSEHSAAGGDSVTVGTFSVDRPSTPLPVAALLFRHPAGVDLGPLRLLGYDRYRLGHRYDPDIALHPGDPLHLTLYWQAQSRPQTDWRVALRLAPATNPSSPVAEGVFPAAGVDYPTGGWEPGEIVRAQFDLFLPGDVTPGDYRVSLGLLDEAGASEGGTFTLAPISVE
jgi:mannosyltransferase